MVIDYCSISNILELNLLPPMTINFLNNYLVLKVNKIYENSAQVIIFYDTTYNCGDYLSILIIRTIYLEEFHSFPSHI